MDERPSDEGHYRADLAYIHHHGFGELAESAAPWIIALLRNAGAQTVVEAGCGSGILARALTNAGLDVFGFDASPAMIALARETAPRARFAAGSFDAMDIPPCDAVIAMGEVLNYGTFAGVRAFVARAARAKLLLFDIAERGSYPPDDERRVEGDDWSVIAIKKSDGRHVTRRVLTFRAGDETMLRDEEVHTLELYDRAEVVALLREHGYRVRIRRSYGSHRLPQGHVVCVALRVP